jgi:hypothetical protein
MSQEAERASRMCISPDTSGPAITALLIKAQIALSA